MTAGGTASCCFVLGFEASKEGKEWMVSAFPAGSTRKVLAPPTAHDHMCSKAKQIPGLSPCSAGAGNAFDRVSAPTPPWQMRNWDEVYLCCLQLLWTDGGGLRNWQSLCTWRHTMVPTSSPILARPVSHGDGIYSTGSLKPDIHPLYEAVFGDLIPPWKSPVCLN